MTRIDKLLDAYHGFTRPTSPVLKGLPRTIQIEPINVCNLKCPTCSVHRLEGSGISRKCMELADFRLIAEQLDPGTDIYLTNWGEPFLSPHIIDIIREGKRLNHHIRVDSNCNFDPAVVPDIVASGLDLFKASIDGCSQETYEKFRVKGDYERAISVVSDLAEEKKRTGKDTPELIWQFIVNRYNEHEMDKALEIAASFASPVRLDFVPMGLRQEKVDWDQYPPDELQRLEEEWIPDNPQFRMDYFNREKQGPAVANSRCSFLWRGHMNISADLGVTPCCHTYLPGHVFGNLRDISIKDLWNAEAFVDSRKLSMAAISRDQCSTVCGRCHNYLNLPDPNIVTRHWRFIAYILTVIRSKLFGKA
jgi:MoaA/NifB/PqqE/SkfB family radical SAM enzyme